MVLGKHDFLFCNGGAYSGSFGGPDGRSRPSGDYRQVVWWSQPVGRSPGRWPSHWVFFGRRMSSFFMQLVPSRPGAVSSWHSLRPGARDLGWREVEGQRQLYWLGVCSRQGMGPIETGNLLGFQTLCHMIVYLGRGSHPGSPGAHHHLLREKSSWRTCYPPHPHAHGAHACTHTQAHVPSSPAPPPPTPCVQVR